MAKQKKTRTRYSAKQRAAILAAADKEGLTATDVQKRFGVIPVTYYSWRKTAKGGGRRGARPVQGRASDGSGGKVRQAVRSKLERQLPAIVEEEVNRYLDSMLGSIGPRRNRA